MPDTTKKYLDLPGLQEYDKHVKNALEEIKASVAELSKPTSYNDLTDKPKINDVELVGNKTHEEIKIAPIDDIELEAILDWDIE